MKRKLFILILTAAICSTEASAQMRDSFYNYLHADYKPKDKNHITHPERLKMLDELGVNYLNKYPSDLYALADYGQQVIDTTRNKDLKIKYAMALAGFYIQRSHYDTVMNYYKQVINYIGNDTVYNSQLGSSYARLGSLYAVKSMSDTAIEYIHKALDVTKVKDSAFMRMIYNGYELIYQELHLYEQSLEYERKALELKPEEDKWGYDYTAVVFRMIECYSQLFYETKQEKYVDSATLLIKQVFEKKKTSADVWYAICYVYLGHLKYYAGDYKNAVSYYDSSFLPQYYIQNSFMYKIANTAKMERAICLLKLGHTENIDILEAIGKTGDNYITTKLDRPLYEYYKEKGNWKKALEYYERYIRTKDSLAVITTKGKIFEANQKYSVAQKEIEIKSLENTNLKEKESKTKITTIAVIAVTVLMLLVMSLYSANKRQQAKRLEDRQRATERRQKELKEERERISQELHDDLGTGLTSIRLLTKRMMAKQVPEQSTEIPNNIYKISGELVDQMSEIIWLMNNPDDTMFGLLAHLRLYMAETIQRTGIDMQLQFENNLNADYNITGAQRRNILLTVKEIFNNAVKHSGASLFNVMCSSNEDKITITMKDDGKGFPVDIPAKGNGLKNIRKRVKSLNGEVEFESVNGTQITISIPT
ncbi:MAG: sensor histidine kinase [Ferruginibacter sp.]